MSTVVGNEGDNKINFIKEREKAICGPFVDLKLC